MGIDTRNKRIEVLVRKRLEYSNIDEMTFNMLVSDIGTFVRNEVEDIEIKGGETEIIVLGSETGRMIK